MTELIFITQVFISIVIIPFLLYFAYNLGKRNGHLEMRHIIEEYGTGIGLPLEEADRGPLIFMQSIPPSGWKKKEKEE